MFTFALPHPPTPLIGTEMYRISSMPVHKRDVYPLFIQRPFEISTGQFLGLCRLDENTALVNKYFSVCLRTVYNTQRCFRVNVKSKRTLKYPFTVVNVFMKTVP